jgi:hypothetical protein
MEGGRSERKEKGGASKFMIPINVVILKIQILALKSHDFMA